MFLKIRKDDEDAFDFTITWDMSFQDVLAQIEETFEGRYTLEVPSLCMCIGVYMPMPMGMGSLCLCSASACLCACVCLIVRACFLVHMCLFVRVRVRVCYEVSAGIGQEFHAQVGEEKFYTYKRNVVYMSHSDIDGSCHI